MMTYGSCAKDPSVFNPTQLDTDQWAQAMADFGAKEAVLVAKHGCGFMLWPSRATMPDGTRYNYSVASTAWRGGKGDVVGDFVASSLKRNISVGYYYSLSSNTYATSIHQPPLTPAQLEAVELQQLAELWDGYGNHGGLSEVWFDGGFEGKIQPDIKALLQKYQPTASAFNGCVVQGGAQSKATCISPNSVRWIGTEAGEAPDPNWSTGFTDGGDPTSDAFCPGECDTTLQNGDKWFYNKAVGIRTLGELQDVYHGTVGRNGFLMMDFAPTPEGIIAPDQAAMYKTFGDWVRGCYSPGSAGMRGAAVGDMASGSAIELQFGGPTTVDRVVVREDQTEGQAIRAYQVLAQLDGPSSAWVGLVNGTSMGNKWIHLLDTNVSVTGLKAVITANASETAAIKSLSGHLCPRAGTSTQCSIRENWASVGVPLGAAVPQATVGQCCELCKGNTKCALFVLSPSRDCQLMSAQGPGGKALPGAVSGSPPA